MCVASFVSRFYVDGGGKFIVSYSKLYVKEMELVVGH